MRADLLDVDNEIIDDRAKARGGFYGVAVGYKTHA
jgi:hypothetical protein